MDEGGAIDSFLRAKFFIPNLTLVLSHNVKFSIRRVAARSNESEIATPCETEKITSVFQQRPGALLLNTQEGLKEQSVESIEIARPGDSHASEDRLQVGSVLKDMFP